MKWVVLAVILLLVAVISYALGRRGAKESVGTAIPASPASPASPVETPAGSATGAVSQPGPTPAAEQSADEMIAEEVLQVDEPTSEHVSKFPPDGREDWWVDVTQIQPKQHSEPNSRSDQPE